MSRRRYWWTRRIGRVYLWLDLSAINRPYLSIQLRQLPRYVALSWGNRNSDPVWSIEIGGDYEIPSSAELVKAIEKPYVDRIIAKRNELAAGFRAAFEAALDHEADR